MTAFLSLITSRNLKENIVSFHFERQILPPALLLRFSAGEPIPVKLILGRFFPSIQQKVTGMYDTNAKDMWTQWKKGDQTLAKDPDLYDTNCGHYQMIFPEFSQDANILEPHKKSRWMTITSLQSVLLTCFTIFILEQQLIQKTHICLLYICPQIQQ